LEEPKAAPRLKRKTIPKQGEKGKEKAAPKGWIFLDFPVF
jgi:hypothetical protein